MSTSWLFTDYPPSRWVIENDLRFRFWNAGLKSMWVSCTKETAPYVCQAEWRDIPFTLEWDPKKFLQLKMKAPNQDLFDAFERMLKHKALAAYKQDNGVIVEWRVTDADARYTELQTTGAKELQRLDKDK